MVGLMDVLSGALNAIDLPRSSAVDLLMGENPIDQWADPFGTTGRRSGRDLLTKWGLTSANKETGMSGWLSDPMEGVADVAGFAVDAFIDPLNAIPVGRLFSALKGRRVASARNRRIDALRGHPERQRVVSEMSDALREQLGPVTAAQQSQDLADLADAAILHKELDPSRVYGQLQVRGPSSPVANASDASDVTLEYPWEGHVDETRLSPLGYKKEDLLYPDIGIFVDQAYREGYSAAEITKTLRQSDSVGFLRSKFDRSTEARNLVHDAFDLLPNINRKRSIRALPDRVVSAILWRGQQNKMLREELAAPSGKRNSMWDQLFTPDELRQLEIPSRFQDEFQAKHNLIKNRKAMYDYDPDSDAWTLRKAQPTADQGVTTDAPLSVTVDPAAAPKNPIEAVLPDPAPVPVETPAAPTTRPVRKPRVKKPEDPLDAAIRAVNTSLRRENVRGEQQLSDIVDTALSGVSSTEARRLLRPKPNPGVQDLTVAFQPDDTVLNPVTQRTTKADPELERLEAAIRPRQEAMQAERRAAQEAAKQAAAARRVENRIDTQRGSAARAVAAELRREQADFTSDAALAAQINATQAQRGVDGAIESLVGGLTPTESRQLANSRLRLNSSDYNQVDPVQRQIALRRAGWTDEQIQALDLDGPSTQPVTYSDYSQVDPEITIHSRSVSMTADRRRLIRPMRGFAAKIDGEWAVPAMAEQSDYWPVYSTPEQARDAALQIVEGMRQSRTNQASAFAPSTPAMAERPMSPVDMVASPEQASALFPEETVRAPNAYGRIDMSLREPQGLTGNMVFGSQANPATAPHELVHWLRGDVFANQNMAGSMQQQKAIEEQVADAIEAALLQGVNTSSPAMRGPLSRLQQNMRSAYSGSGAMMPQRLQQASPGASQAFGELFGVTRFRSPLDRSELPSLMSPIGQYLLQQAAGRFNQYGGVQ